MFPRDPWFTHHTIEFPETLPITAHIDEIQCALKNHQVIVVAGETGSGKTTQLAKILLMLGYGCTKQIGHTQPRRIAARSVAERIAEELKVSLGQEVGFQVRFHQQVTDASYLKIMTDGILLAELSHDLLLKRYEALIIDEAHERSLNIDFILAYLKQLLPKRPDLKIIITSATLDHQRFAKYFNDCPVIEVSGRSYPVEILYHDFTSDDVREVAQSKAIYAAIQSLPMQGDILVFLSGERDIRKTTEFLRKSNLPYTDILPLFSKLNHHEQQKIFQTSVNRRVILATNVAETSLTIPNIYYVIDTGLARVKRYNARSKIQRLPIEPISQASANQRAGRCGRIAPGTCIRLYSEDDFRLREAYTQPEILRSNLASVILQMMSLRLGDAESFAWLDAPENVAWKDAYQSLFELGAIECAEEASPWKLTDIGKQLARLTVDPRLGRMIIESIKNGCVDEVLIIVSVLSISEIFQRPLEHQQAADEKHRLFMDPRSDFLSYLNVWSALQEQKKHLSAQQFKKFCDKHFLSYAKFREWQDLYRELREVIAANAERDEAIPVAYDKIHQSLLSGLLTHIARKDEQGIYIATRQRQVKIFPGSALFKKPPLWFMALEMVETQKVYARSIAEINPLWVESLAPHLIKKTHHAPQFQAKRGEVTVLEKVLLNGLVIVENRRVRLAPIDPMLAHELFLREGMAQRQLISTAKFWQHNEQFLENLEMSEEKSRRRDLVPDEHWLMDFYQAHIPFNISNRQDLEKWAKHLSPEKQQALMLNEAMLDSEKLDAIRAYPSEWIVDGNRLPIRYQFAPGTEDDGVTLEVPKILLPQLVAEDFDWLVPGLLSEKVLALLKALPKADRIALQPLAESAQHCAQSLRKMKGNFFEALSSVLFEEYEIKISLMLLSEFSLADHLRFNFHVMEEGKVIARGRDLLVLQKECANDKNPADESQSISEIFQVWPEEKLPYDLIEQHNSIKLKKFLALQACKDGVMMASFTAEIIAAATHRLGVLKLVQLKMQKQCKEIRQKYFLPKVFEAVNQSSINKAWPKLEADLGAWEDFQQHMLNTIFAMTFADDFWQIRSEKDFENWYQANYADLFANANTVSDWLSIFLKQLLLLNKTMQSYDEKDNTLFEMIQQQKETLLRQGFTSQLSWEWLERYPAYLAAWIHALQGDANKFSNLLKSFYRLENLYQKQAGHFVMQHKLFYEEDPLIAHDPEIFFNKIFDASEALAEKFFFIHEWVMNVFYPSLKPVVSVSEKRLEAKLVEKPSASGSE